MVGGGRGGILSRDDQRYRGNKSNFKVVSRSLAEEDAFDVRPLRKGTRSGILFSIMNLAKGALGGGVLAGHVAYHTSGYVSGIILNVVYGVYICYNFYVIYLSDNQTRSWIDMREDKQLIDRLKDLCYEGFACLHVCIICIKNTYTYYTRRLLGNKIWIIKKWIDVITCINLFGSCSAYQLMIAKSIKHLVEGSTKATIEGQFGYPNLRVYVAAMIIPVILLCLLTDIKYLAPFSIVANAIIGITLITTVYYAFQYNPRFEGMVAFTNLIDQIKYTGMSVFSMSCAGVVIPVENSMKDPSKYKIVIFTGYIFIIGAVFTASFFGYAAFLDKCTSPLTMNFPHTLGPDLLKWGIIISVYVTHALNYFMPFQCVFYYMKPLFKPKNHFKAELFFRALFVVIIGLFGIAFPNIDALMGFLGCFCLSNMAFICPNTIYVMVHYDRPGKNKRFLIARAVCLSLFGVFILICGSLVNGKDMVDTFIASFSGTSGEATAVTPKKP